MINYLIGNLISKKPPLIVLDVNGIGYEVEVPMTTFYDLPEIGTKFKIIMLCKSNSKPNLAKFTDG